MSFTISMLIATLTMLYWTVSNLCYCMMDGLMIYYAIGVALVLLSCVLWLIASIRCLCSRTPAVVLKQQIEAWHSKCIIILGNAMLIYVLVVNVMDMHRTVPSSSLLEMFI